MCFQKWFCVVVLITLAKTSFTQQLALGNTPSSINKSAVLELNADRQGLLLTRITDTVAINALNPPDGMVIYFIPARCLMLRTAGYWSPLAPSSSGVSVVAGTTGNDFNITGSPAVAGSTVTLNLPSASASNRGLLTSVDWNAFNSKQSALTFGNLTTSTTGVTVSGGGGAVIGGGASINVQNATATQNGLLTSADWHTFNNKVGSARSISTTAPLSGGGDLSADRTISMTQATATTNGWLSATDWNTFNNKGAGTVTSVGLSLPSIFSVSNSPVTSTGTLTGTLASQAQNLVFASPNGSTGIPSFRSLVKGDLPSTVVHNDQANSYTAGMKQTFRGNATNAGFAVGGITVDPSTLATGDIWYRSDLRKLKYYDGTTTKILATEGNISGTQNYVSKFTPDGVTLGNSQLFDNGTNIGIGTTAPTNQVHIKATSNPLRLEGLSQISATNTLVVDANGVVGTSPSLQLSFIMKGTFRFDLPLIGNNGNTSFSVSVPGAQVGDNVIVTPSGELTNSNGTGLVIIGYSYVSAADKVTIRFVNPVNISVDVPAMDFYITVLR